MDPWLQSWKLYIPVSLVDVSQFFSLVGSIPKLWQTVFAVILLSLLSISLLFTIYHQFLVLRTYMRSGRANRTPSRKPDPEPRVVHAMRRQRYVRGKRRV